jgi:hypothetical protein
MSDDVYLHFDRRLAVLEERTRPKKRTIFDGVKDWAGILTFVIAVLYTYPLGMWDRFVVTGEQQRTKEIGELRDTVARLAELDAEATRTLSAISNVQQQSMYSQIWGVRKATLLASNFSKISKHFSALSAQELQLLGYELNLLGGQGELVGKILDRSIALLIADHNNIAAADAYRTQAALYSGFGSLGPDALNYRTRVTKAIELLLLADPMKAKFSAVLVAMDWSNFEAISGKWPCAEALGTWAIQQWQSYNAQYAMQLQAQVDQLRTQHLQQTATIPTSASQTTRQEDSICPRDILLWDLVGWPWPVSKSTAQ